MYSGSTFAAVEDGSDNSESEEITTYSGSFRLAVATVWKTAVLASSSVVSINAEYLLQSLQLYFTRL